MDPDKKVVDISARTDISYGAVTNSWINDDISIVGITPAKGLFYFEKKLYTFEQLTAMTSEELTELSTRVLEKSYSYGFTTLIMYNFIKGLLLERRLDRLSPRSSQTSP